VGFVNGSIMAAALERGSLHEMLKGCPSMLK
jgi:hypothetical protein